MLNNAKWIKSPDNTEERCYNFYTDFTITKPVKSAVLTATISGLADKIIAGRKCNAFVLSDLPTGKYSNLYEKDAKNPAGKRFVKATVR